MKPPPTAPPRPLLKNWAINKDLDLLDETLNEESDLDKKLTKLAIGPFWGLGEGSNNRANIFES